MGAMTKGLRVSSWHDSLRRGWTGYLRWEEGWPVGLTGSVVGLEIRGPSFCRVGNMLEPVPLPRRH